MKRKLMLCTMLLFVLIFPLAIEAQTTVTDIDGNAYRTVKIGNQVWMAENLKTTKYRNGDPIPKVKEKASWKALTTGAYCWQNNDAANKATYGGLYNWFAVADRRKIAPTGWHVPTDAEWTVLTDFLGGMQVAGGKMKEAGTTHWQPHDSSGSNSSGFTALPGDYSYYKDGMFYGVGYQGHWWSNTADGATSAWNRRLLNGFANVHRGRYNK